MMGTRELILQNLKSRCFMNLEYLVQNGPHYQAQKEWSWFRAFSQRNPGTIGSAHEGKGESSGSSDFH
ncbi:hypothetical protein L2E82_30029 [Cichorium intybus]|uniref:Uncharacterized protein n=1 Tax=Cichorium intybus TaxID=13427 RepID=A0ACB9CZ85_CICIN|nr:hypothetical protein L2E82_30029 [Cichorium intybus]